MIERNNHKIIVLKEAGEIFSSAITSDYVELSNFGYVDFIICTGVGTAANTTVKIKAKNGTDGEAKAISFRVKNNEEFENVTEDGKTFSIGGVATKCGFGIFRVDSDELAKQGFDRVAINTTAVSSSTVPGAILAQLYEPRYSK